MKLIIFVIIILAVHTADIETQNTLDAVQSVVETNLAKLDSTTNLYGNVDIDDCEWGCYLDRYADLKQSYSNDLNSAKLHYINNGAGEGRDCTCNFSWETKPYCDSSDPKFAERNSYNLRKNPNYRTAWRDQGWISKGQEGDRFSCHGQLIYGDESSRCQGKSVLVSGDDLICGNSLLDGQDACAGTKKTCYCQQQSRFVKKDPYCEDLQFVFASNEGERFSCRGMVRYGAPNNYMIFDSREHSSHTCGQSMGDPFFDTKKTCECASWTQRAAEIVNINGYWKNILVCSPTAANNCMYEVWQSTSTTTGKEVSQSESSEYSVSVGCSVSFDAWVTETEVSVEVGYSTASEVTETVSTELSSENGNQVTIYCAPGTWMYTWNYLLSGSDGTEFVQSTTNFQCNPPETGPRCHPKLCVDDFCTQCRDGN